MVQTPKEESEVLLNKLLPFAQQQLQKHGEFFPSAAVMLTNSQVQMLATHDGDEHPESQKVIDNTEEAFVRGAKNSEYKATALAYMISARNPDTGEKEDAICFNLDHLNDYSVQLIFLYTVSKKLLGGNKVQFFAPTAAKGEGKIFGKK